MTCLSPHCVHKSSTERPAEESIGCCCEEVVEDVNDNDTCYKIKNKDYEKPKESTPALQPSEESDPPTETTPCRPEKVEPQVRCNLKGYRLLRFEEAPEYLQFNPFILSGYRGLLNTKLCMESVFWWTNETINIWSHIFGLLLFTGLAINDVVIINIDAPFGDKVIVTFILFCFQVCMFLSALYHTFNCRSEHDYNHFLTFDLFGIALALYAVYISGIYYAYWCDQEWGNFYMLSVTVIFIMAMIIQIPKLKVDSNVKMIVFVGWALYGVIPTAHWYWLMGGYQNPLVQVLLPRVFGMYLISGTAFIIYLTKVPERFFPGKVDFLGHSHQWWHMFILMALYYWHNSGMIYVQYRMNHACLTNMHIL